MKTHQSFSKIASIVIAQYKGNDPSFKNRASFWIDHLGDLPFDQITPDDIEEGLAKYIARGKLKVIRVGHGPGAVEFESTGKPLSPATINRMRIAVSSIVKFAKEKYLLPNTYISPVKGTRRQNLQEI